MYVRLIQLLRIPALTVFSFIHCRILRTCIYVSGVCCFFFRGYYWQRFSDVRIHISSVDTLWFYFHWICAFTCIIDMVFYILRLILCSPLPFTYAWWLWIRTIYSVVRWFRHFTAPLICLIRRNNIHAYKVCVCVCLCVWAEFCGTIFHLKIAPLIF